MGSSPSIPTPPDPYQTAGAQQQLNEQTLAEQQASNNVNQFTPYGSLNYYQTGTGPNGIPTYSAVQQMSAPQQGMLNQLQGGQLMSGAAGENLMANAAGMYGGGVPNLMQGANSMTSQMMGNEEAYLQPFFQPQQSQLDNQLRNQGIMPGTPAYQQQMNNLLQSQGQQENGFLAQAEPMAFQQAVTQYQLPGQEAQQLMGFGSPNQLAQISPPQGQMQPANLLGAVSSDYAAQMQAYQAQLSQQNAMMSGLGSLGSAGILAMGMNGGLGSMFGGAAAGSGAADIMGSGAGMSAADLAPLMMLA